MGAVVEQPVAVQLVAAPHQPAAMGYRQNAQQG